MRSTSSCKTNGFLAILVCLAMGVNVYGGETVTVPVIVNVVGDTNAGDMEAAVEEASEILGQAGINLEVERINNNVQYSDDGDSNLTQDEGDTAAVLGEGELDGTFGPGTGLKITIANNVWTEKPATVGWAVHEDQVAFVEPNSDTNDMGRAIAHELAHLLTINYDLYDGNDPNRLMWGYVGGGTLLDANEVNEIFPMAKRRGMRRFVQWKPPPPEKGRLFDGWEYVIDGRGWILDTLFDHTCAAPGFDPCDPNWGYADLRTAGMFWDRPMDPCDNIVFKIRVKSHYDVDSFFDVWCRVRINWDTDPNIDAELSMHVFARPPDTNLYGEALLNNFETGLITPFELIIHANYKFDGGPPILANHSLECDVPAGYFDPGSDPFEGWACQVTSEATDERLGGVLHPITDETLPFEFKLNEPFEEEQMSMFVPYGADGNLGLAASGFPAMSMATIMMDGAEVGITQVRPNGTVMAWIPQPPEGQDHTCKLVAEVIDPIDPNVTRYTTTTAYFKTCAEGAINGDLNADCEVNFKDLAVIADNWLAGV
jgi:hypothetical protein